MIVAAMLSRCWWALLRRFVDSHFVDGLEFLDLRGKREPDSATLRRFLGDAIYDVEWAGFGPLLHDNLRTVVATDLPERAIPAIRGYFCNFASLGLDKRALGCRMLWFAKYYEAGGGGATGRRHRGDLEIALACFETELAFVQKFPDSEEWVQFLMANHDPRR